MAETYNFSAEREAWGKARSKVRLTNAQGLAIVGLLTNIATGRMNLVDRKGDAVELTQDETTAIEALRKAWAKENHHG